MSNFARFHRAVADACEVEIQALALMVSATKRRRDAHREMERFFTPPVETPPPRIEPGPTTTPDPDFTDEGGL